jgi:hypothetical protein
LLVTGPWGCSSSCTEDSKPLKVERALVLGHSFWFGTNSAFRDVMAARDPEATFELKEIAHGGATLAALHARPETLPAIAEGWDAVVIMGDENEPLTKTASFEKHADLLAAAATSTGARAVFFETWVQEAGSPIYSEPWAKGDPAAQHDAIRAAYDRAADRAKAEVSPVGTAWQRSLQDHPGLKLHAPDGVHQTETGSYLAACVLYVTLTRRSPVGLKTKYLGSAADAAKLQAVAQAVAGR